LYYRMKATGAGKPRQIVKFATLLALAASCRLQLGPSAAALGLFALSQFGVRIIPMSLVGLTLGLLPKSLVDYYSVGIPFLPAWNYLHYALGGEEGGKVWGTSPWWFYFPQFFETWYPPLTLLLLPILILGLWLTPGLGVVVTAFTVVHIAIAHKETRYFSPMIPFMQLATFSAWESLEQQGSKFIVWVSRWPRTGAWFLGLFILEGIGSGFLDLNTSPDMYAKLGQLIANNTIKTYTYVGNTRTAPSKFYTKTPNDSHLVAQESWDHVRTDGTKLAGWLAFYAIDPDDFNTIKMQCSVEYVSISSSEQRLLSMLPKGSPIRRRVNAIAWCQDPLKIQSH
ncbi:MAG: hypothetical protein NTV34_07370, partial [Proteobacteria bacterium]|nr:hypothetical protein [Pseudomonadota bacterium]